MNRGKTYAVIVAVESTFDPAFPPATYAENDGRLIASALKSQGCEDADITLLSSKAATKTMIESALRSCCKRLRSNDTLIFHYSGHAFSAAGKSFLLCFDTLITDREDTALSLEFLIGSLGKSGCENIFVFIDGNRGLQGLSEPELEKLCADGGASILFSACAHAEESQSSARLKHGIWAYHLGEALRGNAEALDKARSLTAQSLQAYLAGTVPKSVRTLLAGNRLQTPRLYGNAGNKTIISDMASVASGSDGSSAEANEFKMLEQAFFRGMNFDSVKRLSGWIKGHRLPDQATQSAASFVQSAGADDLKSRFESFHDRIRKTLKYIRSDLTSSASAGGFSCITPDFTFSINLDLDAREPSRYVETLVLSEIRNPDIIASKEFGLIFDSEFDEAVLEYSRPFDVRKIIDVIEAMPGNMAGGKSPDGSSGSAAAVITVEYPSDARECTVVFRTLKVSLKFTGSTLVYAFTHKTTVHKIMEAIKNAPKVLRINTP